MLLRKINVTTPILPAPSTDPWIVHAGKFYYYVNTTGTSIMKPHLIIYHAMDKPDAGWQGRTARVQGFKWKGDGMPDFGVPLNTGTANGRESI